MRDILDTKRHYRNEGAKTSVPGFSQMGTIIQGPAEFFSSRIVNRDRQRTFADEILATEQSAGRFRNRYMGVQAAATSGKKAFYKKLKAKRAVGTRRL